MYKIAVIPGDGIGPEVIAEGLKVLEAVSEKFKFKYHFEHYDLGGERYLKTGEILPGSVLEELKGMDAICMWMVKNPVWFDVIVTDNMFGDIITDLAAMIQGGLGIAAGGNINPRGVSVFEPMGDSAPKYAGKGVVSPLAAISVCQMMMEHLSEEGAAREIERAVMKVLERDVKSLSAGQMGYSTSEVGDLVVKYILNE